MPNASEPRWMVAGPVSSSSWMPTAGEPRAGLAAAEPPACGAGFRARSPVRELAETRSLRQRCSVPIMLDELVLEDSDLVP